MRFKQSPATIIKTLIVNITHWNSSGRYFREENKHLSITEKSSGHGSLSLTISLDGNLSNYTKAYCLLWQSKCFDQKDSTGSIQGLLLPSCNFLKGLPGCATFSRICTSCEGRITARFTEAEANQVQPRKLTSARPVRLPSESASWVGPPLFKLKRLLFTAALIWLR